MRPDIEKYLNGEMNEEERQQFEQLLAQDPQLQAALEEGRALIDRLHTQMLREKITAALQPDGVNENKKQKPVRKWLWMSIVLILVLSALFFFYKKSEKPKLNNTLSDPPADILDSIDPDDVNPLPEDLDTEEPVIDENREVNPPIAGDLTIPPSDIRPDVRGEEGLETDWDKLVESVWKTRFEVEPETYNAPFKPSLILLGENKFTDAFVELQLLEMTLSENDTLAFLKGYCLLELREGEEAIKYFEKIREENDWQPMLDWYKTLAYLLTGDQPEIMKLLEPIARTPDHPFQEEAKKLLNQLK